MRLDEMRAILITIKLAGYGNKPITRHAVARNITAWSRSTTYRKIDKLIVLGLLYLCENGELVILVKGEEFLNDFVALRGLEHGKG